MPKAMISRAEMKRLLASGLTTDAIAMVAGVHPQCAVVRVSTEKTEHYRRASRERYTNLSDPERRKYLDSQRDRVHAAQLESRETAAVFGAWRTDEVKYLEAFGKELTTLEIAKKLRRTFFSVKKAAARYKVSLRID